MSKVKNYMDSNKTKARHRNRIDETRRTKAKRIRKCNNWTYNWLRGGYYHKTEKEIRIYEYFDVPERIAEYQSFDRTHYYATGESRFITKTRVIPAHSGRRLIETKIIPVSILRKGLPRRAKFYKTQAKRRFRRNNSIVNEDSYLLKGNAYRKAYEVDWSIY